MTEDWIGKDILTPSSSVYASGQSLNVNNPQPNDQREYEPNETRNHHGSCFELYYESLFDGELAGRP